MQKQTESDRNASVPHPTPRTIEELRAWYEAHNLPPEDVTRFFIGKNVQEARAFGIYQEGDRFVVYKNKDNGQRAIRYEGIDEGYAVNELYQRLKQEIAGQKFRSAEEQAALQKANRRKGIIVAVISVVIFAAILAFSLWSDAHTPNRGYYHYNDDWYYYQSGMWYYDYDDAWYPCETTPEVAGHYSDSYAGEDYTGDASCPDFAMTEYYSTTDSDSSWSSSDTWDSGSTDWGSDW